MNRRFGLRGLLTQIPRPAGADSMWGRPGRPSFGRPEDAHSSEASPSRGVFSDKERRISGKGPKARPPRWRRNEKSSPSRRAPTQAARAEAKRSAPPHRGERPMDAPGRMGEGGHGDRSGEGGHGQECGVMGASQALGGESGSKGGARPTVGVTALGSASTSSSGDCCTQGCFGGRKAKWWPEQRAPTSHARQRCLLWRRM
mmetsp:Transcript_76131/g.168617  ORF Transcript_76131/g.168617 Transcript_76131/m.168617 type:complete len:201 (+) Transcript_76131:135-737(+)